MPVRRDTLVAAQYLTAVAGMAAMRHCLSRPSSVRARLDDVRQIVEHLDEFPQNAEIPVVEHDFGEGYAAWAPRYDGPNPAVETDQAVVHEIVARAPPTVGRALDAACGTGRHAAHLDRLGYEVIGVDASEAMLAVARTKLPAADLRLGRLEALPVDDASVDLVTCSLALTHVAELGPVMSELARVLRPGGWAVVSDIHPIATTFGNVAIFPTDATDFELAYVPNLVHGLGEYVTAAVAAGLVVAECLEPTFPNQAIESNPAYAFVPDAVRQAFTDLPFLLVWRFTRPG